ncbi:MAG: creatininase family protein [Chloroflexi bacterium]|nr:creatininase family protein [Chloroflexota bacterium]
MKELREVLWSERTREEIPQWAGKGAVVVMPIASTEQHGQALPLDTDCRTVEYVSRRAARLADDVPVLVAPLIPYGISPHHMRFAGTISISVTTLIDFLGDICRSIVAHGFAKIVLLSGHGGNGDTIKAAALELRHRLGCQIDAFCWWDLASAEIDAITEGPCHTIGHAGEAEASCVLALDPEAVRCEKAGWVEGISDDPAIATPEKGQRILEAGAQALAKYLRDMAARPAAPPVGIVRAGTSPAETPRPRP